MMKQWKQIQYQQEYDDIPREVRQHTRTFYLQCVLTSSFSSFLSISQRSGHAAVLVGKAHHMVMFGGESDETRGMKHQVT